MPMDSSLDPFKQLLRNLYLFKPPQSQVPFPWHWCPKVVSLGNAPFKWPYLLAHTSSWCVLSIIEFRHHKLLIAHGLTRVTSSLRRRRSQRLGPSTTLGSLGPSHQQCHKFQVSFRGSPLCPWCFGHSSQRGTRQSVQEIDRPTKF